MKYKSPVQGNSATALSRTPAPNPSVQNPYLSLCIPALNPLPRSVTKLSSGASIHESIHPLILSVVALMTVAILQACSDPAPSLKIERKDSNTVLTFNARLQSSTNIEGPYTNVFGAASPLTSPTSTAPQRFWRTRHLATATIAAGVTHTAGIKLDGSLWQWGENIGNRPQRVGTDNDWTAVASYLGATTALKRDGSLWWWPRGSPSPERFETDRDWIVIASGSGWAAVKADASLWASFQIGQLARIDQDNDWASVACGYTSFFAIKSDRSLWAWGLWNDVGQLGIGTFDPTNRPARVGTDTNWEAVVCGWKPGTFVGPPLGYSIALKTNGTLWAWGAGDRGELGLGPTIVTNRPTRIDSHTDWAIVACGDQSTFALKKDGTLWFWGAMAQTNRPVRFGTDSNWTAVTVGRHHTVAMKSDGTLWAWGINDQGQLGDGTNTSTNAPGRVLSDTPWAQ